MVYQTTLFDCGPVAIINALNYVLNVDEFPPSFLKMIYGTCLDGLNTDGVVGGNGTSQDAIRFIATWLNDYHEKTNFPLECTCIENDDVTLLNNSNLLQALRAKNAAVVIRCMLDVEHYITLLDADDDKVYAFDPYYWSIDYDVPGVERLSNPFAANCCFPVDFMETTNQQYYNLNLVRHKIAIIVKKTP